MILVYGRMDDPPTAATVEALHERGHQFILLDQRALGYDGLVLETGSDGVRATLFRGGEAIELAGVDAVFARPLELELRDVDSGDAAGARLLHEQLLEWMDVSPARVVNRPAAMQSNASKPLQLQLIGAAGLVVPETLVTSDPEEVRAFRREHGRVIFKSTSGIRSIVRELDDLSATRLALLTALPVQFQALVPGVDVRVHVVGTEVFAAEIRTNAVDYRYAIRDGAAVSFAPALLPDIVAQRCVHVATALGLPLAGIDLRRRPDGEYVCFEVNPMPAYTYFESNTGLPIADAVARLLGGEQDFGTEDTHGSSNREPDRYRRQDHRPQAAPHA
jgi:glutathione synthase/RimK-type ligase-like ATP-grasp enzyme